MKVVTIDGPSGAEKTAVGMALSKEYQVPFMNIGTFYRSLASAKLQNRDVKEAASQLKFTVRSSKSGAAQVHPTLNGQTFDQELFADPRTERISEELFQSEEIRNYVDRQVQRAASKGAIVAGRSASEAVSANASLYLANTKDKEQKKAPLRFLSRQIAWDSTHTPLPQTCSHIKRWLDHQLGIKPLTLSVIIPVFNREEHLRHTLDHLKKQTLSSAQFEIIVVDDGSTDGTADVARSFGICPIQIPHSGPSAARNQGIEAAQGDIFLFLDSDILIEPDFLEKNLLLHSHTNNLVLVGARRQLPEQTFSIAYEKARLDSREKLLFRHSFALNHLNHPWSLAYTCNLSMPRHLVDNERFDETFIGWGLEDVEFAYRMFKKGGRFAYSRRTIGYHQYHDRSNSPARYASWLKNLELMKAKHSDPSIHSFDLFKPVFDPQVQADYFQVFDQFDPPPQTAGEPLDLSDFSGDPLAAIQQEYLQREAPIQLIDSEEHALYEVYLPFLDSQVVSFFPKAGLR